MAAGYNQSVFRSKFNQIFAFRVNSNELRSHDITYLRCSAMISIDSSVNYLSAVTGTAYPLDHLLDSV
ncbi:hypothetical protein AHF37_08274 [Paragonimus kellicotti]|nr:hypothetical protein AHF37_08274 [Paragonimus kellicotti]